MTDTNGTATYVYCLLSARRTPPPTRRPRGLAGTGPVRALDVDDGLRLIVADAPLSRYGTEPIEQHLRDLGWVSSCALAHERVVEHFARHGTVIPMKLFTLFAGDDRAVDHVRRSLKRVRRVLTRVSDRQEWGVRLRLDEQRALRQRMATEGKSTGAVGGTAFLVRKQRERQAVQDVAKARQILGEADASLLDLVDHVLNKGVFIEGEVLLGLADVDLVYLRLSALLCAADRLTET